jgi:7-keto-8-aminopelargonate synthetase-like enzyme
VQGLTDAQLRRSAKVIRFCSLVFCARLPAASVAAVTAALEIMRREPERRERLLPIASRLREKPRLRGLPVLDGKTAIVPVVPNEIDLCLLCIASSNARDAAWCWAPALNA